LSGQVDLYDIDLAAASLNESLGNMVQSHPEAVSSWRYRMVPTLKEALLGADFVVISIQPGSLEVMRAEIEIA
jgi:alpha-galactosidase